MGNRVRSVEMQIRGATVEELDFWETWREAAACSKVDDVDFFADDEISVGRAKAVCAGCVAMDDCLAFAIETNQSEGVWGGHTASERARLRRLWLRDLRRAS